MLRSRRLALLPLAGVLGVVVAFVVAGTPVAPAKTSSSQPARLSVGVEVMRFRAVGRKLTGTGFVTARLQDNRGHTDTVRTRVALSAAAGSGCQVLHLYLKQLNLTLLGLNVHLDKVNLVVTGQPTGGVLGRLFCALARAKVTVSGAALHRLNERVARSQGHALRFTANINPQTTSSTAAGATCPVLNLLLGPLHVQLLGLVVDLNQVHLVITATRGQGVLGDLFCNLADNSTTGSSSTSTSSTSTTTSSTTTTTAG